MLFNSCVSISSIQEQISPIILRNFWQQNQDAELFAIDNILNQDDYQSAITHASSSGLKIGKLLNNEFYSLIWYGPYDMVRYDLAPYDMAPYDMVPYDMGPEQALLVDKFVQ